jgi:uncharacterized membrane protein
VFLIIGLVLLGIWLIGFGLFRAIVGGVIHVFLILALFLLAWHFISHSRHATGGNTSTASGTALGTAVGASALASR